MNDIINDLKRFIPEGKENAIHLSELSNNMHMNESKVKKLIQKARQSGYLDICSSNAGYWISKDEEERKAFEKMLRRHALTCLKTTKPIRDSLKEYKGQISLSEASGGVSEEVTT